MEKNIQTLLFSSLVSLREHRLIGVDATPEQQFEDSAAKIEKSIEDPAKLTTEVIKEIADLKVKAIEGKHDQKKLDRLQGLENLNNTKNELLAKLPEIEKKTAADNPDWVKLQKELSDPDAATKDKAEKACVKLITDARKEMGDLAAKLDLSDTALKPLIKVRVKVLAAHNKTIENVQAADPENKIKLVDPATGGDVAKTALTKLEADGKIFISGSFDTLLQKFNAPGGGLDAKKINRENIDAAVLAQREVIYGQMNAILAKLPLYVNAEKQVSELLKQLKQMNEAVASLTPVPEAKVDATKPAEKPADKAPISKEAAVKDGAEADKILKDKGVEASKVDALTAAKDPVAQAKALEDLNKDAKVVEALKDPAASKVVVDALNKKLEATGSKLKVEVKDGKIVPKTETVLSGEAAKKVEGGKETFSDVLKAFIAFIKDLAKELGMSPKEFFTGKADPSKVNASNAPTSVVAEAKNATEKELAKTKDLSKEAAAREKTAPPAEKQKLRAETLKQEARIKELTTRVERLEQERVKCVQKDEVVDRRCRTISEEAARRGAPCEVRPSADRRTIILEARSRAGSAEVTRFFGGVEQEFGSSFVRGRDGSGRINTCNIQVGNGNVIQNQVTTGGIAAQAQSVESRPVEAPKAAPASTISEEAKPKVTVIPKKPVTGSIDK